MIADCPLPKNPKEINKNKKEFQASQANFGSARYHIDENQKFGHIRPGLPSDKLRKALGLRDDQVGVVGEVDIFRRKMCRFLFLSVIF